MKTFRANFFGGCDFYFTAKDYKAAVVVLDSLCVDFDELETITPIDPETDHGFLNRWGDPRQLQLGIAS